MARASLAAVAVAVNVPTPIRRPTLTVGDGHSPYGSYSRNIMNLEQRAEEMSSGGSDIGEEIRRMNEESRERSRQNSILSSHQGDVDGDRGRRGGSGSGSGSGSVHGGAGGSGVGVGRSDTSLSRTPSSVVSVNGAARWGGYSPGGFVASPVGSLKSPTWSHASVRKPSAPASVSSRLVHVEEPSQGGSALNSPSVPGSYFPASRSASRQPSLSTSSRYQENETNEEETKDQTNEEVTEKEETGGAAGLRQTSDSSFGQHYNLIARQIALSLQHVPPSPPKHTVALHEGEHEQPNDAQESEPVVPPPRPRSTDTFQEAQLAFKDFDGVHFSPNTEEFVKVDEQGNEVRRVSARNSSGALTIDAASLLQTPRARPITYVDLPPDEEMVYYPAPVPRMLNLPKRLSQVPAAHVVARRRTQLVSDSRTRHSALVSPTAFSEGYPRSPGSGPPSAGLLRPMLNERMNTANMPPQLRASIYFQHQPLPQEDVDIQSESAVATLDNILEASATAPVNAFTFAGDTGRPTLASTKAAARRSMIVLPTTDAMTAPPLRQRPNSTFGNLVRRTSSGDEFAEQLRTSGSRSSLLTSFNEGGNKLQKRKSVLSAADGLNQEPGELEGTPANVIPEPNLTSGLISQAGNADGVEDEVDESERPATAYRGEGPQIEDDFGEEEEQEDVEDSEPFFAAPTTLLAELQVRKANLKSRNRTAATSYPNGMHSTLLQLDAVEEIRNRKRKQQRVALAWEEPGLGEGEPDVDDEVPLGMLYPDRSGLISGKKRMGDGRDWGRPLGLMARRELEDSEPLRSRRNRLQGLPPNYDNRRSVLPNMSQMQLVGQPSALPEIEVDEGAVAEVEGETLGQRLRRLKTKSVLDTAIADVAPMTGSSQPISTFSDDVLAQFGGAEVDEEEPKAGEAPPDQPKPNEDAPEEETLGQRRARLQRERDASGSQPAPAQRPAMLRSSTSFANLLAANPVAASGHQKISRDHLPAQGTLLHSNARDQAKQKADIYQTNARSSSYNVGSMLGVGGAGANDATPRPNTMRERPQSMAGLLAPSTVGANTPFSMGGGPGAGGGYFAQNRASAYFPTPGMSTPFAATPGGMMGYPSQPPQQPQAPMMNPMPYSGLTPGLPGMAYPGLPPVGWPQMPYGAGAGTGMGAGMGMGMGMGMNMGMPMPMSMPMQMSMPMPPGTGPMGTGGMNMGMAMEEPLDPRQRDAIDRWRMSVAQ